METITITVESRKGLGKGEAGRMRRQGRVPGVFYGPGKQAASLSIDAREFRTKIGGLEGSHLIQLASSLPELQDKIAILREVQRRPFCSMLSKWVAIRLDDGGFRIWAGSSTAIRLAGGAD